MPVDVDTAVARTPFGEHEFHVDVGITEGKFRDNVIPVPFGVGTTTPSLIGQSIFSPAMLRNEWFPLPSSSTITFFGTWAGSLF